MERDVLQKWQQGAIDHFKKCEHYECQERAVWMHNVFLAEVALQLHSLSVTLERIDTHLEHPDFVQS